MSLAPNTYSMTVDYLQFIIKFQELKPWPLNLANFLSILKDASLKTIERKALTTKESTFFAELQMSSDVVHCVCEIYATNPMGSSFAKQ